MAPLVSKRLVARPGLMVGILSLNLVAAGLWFFKGSAWAARVDRTPWAPKPSDRGRCLAARPAMLLEIAACGPDAGKISHERGPDASCRPL